MRGVFFLLALMSGVLGIVTVFANPLDPTVGLSGVMLLLNSAGWAGVGKIAYNVEQLSKKKAKSNSSR